MSKTYYKVVAFDKTIGYISATTYNFIIYKKNEWINAPPNTRLFVFEKLDDAIKFAKHWESVVYECKVKGGFNGYGTLNMQKPFWEKVNKYLSKKKRLIGINLCILLIFLPF